MCETSIRAFVDAAKAVFLLSVIMCGIAGYLLSPKDSPDDLPSLPSTGIVIETANLVMTLDNICAV